MVTCDDCQCTCEAIAHARYHEIVAQMAQSTSTMQVLRGRDNHANGLLWGLFMRSGSPVTNDTVVVPMADAGTGELRTKLVHFDWTEAGETPAADEPPETGSVAG